MHTQTFIAVEEIRKALRKKIFDIEWYVKYNFRKENVLEEIDTLTSLKNALTALK